MSQRKNLSKRLARLGPTALVTGASDGMGHASAEELARTGFDLILCARREHILTTLADKLTTQYGVNVRVVGADLSTPEGMSRLSDEIESEDIGTAVMAAGFGTSGRFGHIDLDNERNMLAVNCDAVLTLTHILTNKMIKRGSGHIVLFSSIVAFQGNGFSAHYAATKSWVQSLAEGLRVELAPHDISVLAVAPGPVQSGFSERANMQMGAATTPSTVGKAIRAHLGKSGTIRPGLLSKVLGWSLAFTPRPIRVRIMTQIMSGMSTAK